MRFIKWMFRAWPVLLQAALVAAHLLLLSSLPGHAQQINKYLGPGLQVLGALLVVISIDQNLGIFRGQSLVGMILGWLRDFPIRKPKHHVFAAGTGGVSFGGGASVMAVRGPMTIEERVAELERKQQELQRALDAKAAELSKRIDEAKAELHGRLEEHRTEVAQLKERVERVTVGGFKMQAFGVMLAIHGSVAGAFA